MKKSSGSVIPMLLGAAGGGLGGRYLHRYLKSSNPTHKLVKAIQKLVQKKPWSQEALELGGAMTGGLTADRLRDALDKVMVEKGAQATPFTDGVLLCCYDHDLTPQQAVKLAGEGQSLPGALGEEFTNLLGRLRLMYQGLSPMKQDMLRLGGIGAGIGAGGFGLSKLMGSEGGLGSLAASVGIPAAVGAGLGAAKHYPNPIPGWIDQIRNAFSSGDGNAVQVESTTPEVLRPVSTGKDVEGND